ncbi:hypothetical protein PVAND_009432 [Polypedilum vanderplanki]|uniref:NACHT domain-containing protein n=1 Tax=Polypedilum vanderplanki TaxID=319348 RepID=A0A9J6CDI2_POLVA|nr:hypothetical protein PVAND_009432 [Polypedilum vanderplanki]
MSSLVDKFFNIFNFIIGINQHQDFERVLPQRQVSNYKVEKVMINEFAKLTKLKSNPESIQKKIFDKSKRIFIERKFRLSGNEVLSLNDLIAIIEYERIGLIVGNSGSGKSRTIERICQVLQSKSSKKLIFHVNFGNFLEKFERNDLNFNEKFSLKFLLNFDNYEYEIFKELSCDERILVFFDGFDEIALNYKNEIINLLQSIKKNTKIAFWLSSRSENAEELEYELKIKSYEILPFTFDDAKDYIQSILTQINYDRSKFEKMLENFFLNDNLNQPIILDIIEEILLDKHANESLTKDVNLIHIFIKRKIEFSEFCESLLLSLLRLAIHTIFNDKFVLCGSKSDKINRNELLKLCLITFTADKRELQFVDRKFADFFIAEYVIKNIWIYGSFFPQFDGDRRLLGFLLNEILDVRNYGKYSLIYDSLMTIIECGKIKERIQLNSENTIEFLNSEKFNQFMTLNPNIFTIILKFTNSSDFNDQNVANYLQYLNLMQFNPPLILSFECISDKSSSIFYYQNKKYHKAIINNITEENFLQTIKNEFNFNILLSAIKSKVIGSFYGSFDQMKINIEDFYNQKRLIDYALEQKDEISIKFLQIFDNFDVFKENLKLQTILEIAAEKCEEREFKMIIKDEKSLLDFRNRNGRNLLMIAAKYGNDCGIKYLLKLNFNIDEKIFDQTAADLAYENNNCGVLNLLLNSNSKFPEKFDKNILETETSFEKEKLKEFIKISEEMHNYVMIEDHKKINDLCTIHQNLRYFYNLSNETALASAMKHRKIQNYHLLSSKGFLLSPHEQSQENFHENFSHPKFEVIDKHLREIYGKIFITNAERNKSSSIEIMNALIELSKKPEVNAILKIAAKIENLEIIFDFQSQNQSFISTDRKILIAAHGLEIDTSKNKILATFFSKMCQRAMSELFKNDGNPYNKNDVDTKLKFFKITKQCYENSEKDANMKFLFHTFNSENWHKELVALVPYLIVLNKNNEIRLNYLRKIFNDLFEFYEEFIMKKIELKFDVVNF